MADKIDCLCQQHPCGMREVSSGYARVLREQGAVIHNGIGDPDRAYLPGQWVHECWLTLEKVEAELGRNRAPTT